MGDHPLAWLLLAGVLAVAPWPRFKAPAKPQPVVESVPKPQALRGPPQARCGLGDPTTDQDDDVCCGRDW